MACFFVLALLHSFSSHCFPPFSFSPPRENDIFALERAHLCWRSNPYGCIESSRELYIHQRSRRGACLSVRVSKKIEVPLVNILRGRIFSYSSAAAEYKLCWDFPLWDGFSRRCEADEHPSIPPPPPSTHTFVPVKLTRENEANEITSTGWRNGQIWCFLLVIWQYLEASSTSDSHFLPVIFNQPFLPKIKGETLVASGSDRTMTARSAAALSLCLGERINSHVAALGARCPPAHCPVPRNTASAASHSAPPHLLQVSGAGRQSSKTFL